MHICRRDLVYSCYSPPASASRVKAGWENQEEVAVSVVVGGGVPVTGQGVGQRINQPAPQQKAFPLETFVAFP